MGITEYFQALIYILMITTFITLILAFLYMIYGKEKESS